MKSFVLTALFCFVVVHANGAFAQSEYARQPGDTLSYVETTDVDIVVDSPQGRIDVAANVDTKLDLAFVTPDTLAAWYTMLDVSTQSPLGNQNPSTESVINVPFRLVVSPRGNVETISTPAVSPELRTISDVRRQFEDFFLVLPEEELEVGLSWEYYAAVDDSASVEGRHAFTKSGLLTVVGDTTVSGIHGLKIEGDLETTLLSTSTDPNMGAEVINNFSGVERNVVVFSPERGVMVLRERNADLSGTTEYIGGAMPFSMQQTITYTSSTVLQP